MRKGSVTEKPNKKKEKKKENASFNQSSHSLRTQNAVEADDVSSAARSHGCAAQRAEVLMSGECAPTLRVHSRRDVAAAHSCPAGGAEEQATAQ